MIPIPTQTNVGEGLCLLVPSGILELSPVTGNKGTANPWNLPCSHRE